MSEYDDEDVQRGLDAVGCGMPHAADRRTVEGVLAAVLPEYRRRLRREWEAERGERSE